MNRKKNIHKDYEKIKELSYEAHLLNGISSLISWDQETVMPEGAHLIRGEQLKALSGLIHEAKTSNRFFKALSNLIDMKSGKIKSNQLSEAQNRALHCWRKDYLKEISLPKKFVQEFAKTTSESIIAWTKAKKENDFLSFQPHLEKIVLLNQQKADYLGFKKDPYDALLDCYEPDITTEEVTKLFQDLKKSLTTLLKNIQKKTPCNNEFLFGKFREEDQLAFGHEILQEIGYDLKFGRLDLSAHPFSSASHPTDSRITTRIHPTGLMSNILSVLHEAGHALYEMGLPVEQYGTPLGEAVSLGIHESQSRFYETRIGLSKPFWDYFYPKLQSRFKTQLNKISKDQFYLAIHHVEPSLIRIEADEVTYNLHIILRFEIEHALISGDLKVKDLPDAWNAKMKELLGVTPKTDREGCLQDIHWSMGAFGYFPTYTLGNIYASHLFLGFEKDNPLWETKIANGEFGFIKDWLQKHVYQFGRQFTSQELLERATHKKLSSKAYIDYLKQKYIK